jgi:hypothetical protein
MLAQRGGGIGVGVTNDLDDGNLNLTSDYYPIDWEDNVSSEAWLA